MRRDPAIGLAALAIALLALVLCGWPLASPAQEAPPQEQPRTEPAPAATESAPGCPDSAQAASAGPAKPAAVNLSGAWDAKAQGSTLEAFVTQKGPILLAVAYVTQPDGKVSCYHMAGVIDNGKVHVAHKDGYVFDGQTLGPNSVCGTVTIKNYPIRIETTAVRRVQGQLHDEQADAFFRETLPLLPDPVK
jgi:hypothetical protein